MHRPSDRLLLPALRFALLGGLAFACACVAHEAVGHGGACALSGGHVLLLTSVFFRCRPGLPIVDAAGPLMNLVVAAIALLALRRLRAPGDARELAALVAAFSALWGAGYFLFSAVTNGGDWAFVWRELDPAHPAAWRVLMGVLGAAMYVGSLRIVAPTLPCGAALAWAWAGAGVVATASVLFFAGPLLPALREAVDESLLASCGLLVVAHKRRDAMAIDDTAPSARGPWFTVVGVGLLVVFVATMGPGFRGP